MVAKCDYESRENREKCWNVSSPCSSYTNCPKFPSISFVLFLFEDVSVRIYDWIYGNFFATTPSSSDLPTILAKLVPSSSPDYNPLLEGIDKFVSERAFSISQKDKNEFEVKRRFIFHLYSLQNDYFEDIF